MTEMSESPRIMKGLQDPNPDLKSPSKRMAKSPQCPHQDQSQLTSGCVPSTGQDVSRVKDVIKKNLDISTSLPASA